MDSISQAVLGAAVGETVLGRKVGNKAILWGAIIGTIPDLDVIPGQFMDTVDRLAFHRGFSHSLMFAITFAPLAGWLIQKIHRKENATKFNWANLFFWIVSTHILLDCFTTWGTQVFWPLDYRVAWNTIFVIDPLYTLPFLFFIILLMFKHKDSKIRRKLGMLGLTISTAYLLVTVVNKQIANDAFETALAKQGIEYTRYSTRPTPFNSVLWSATVETESGFYEGLYSLFDSHKQIKFSYVEKNHHLINGQIAQTNVKQLIKLTKGFYTVETLSDGVLINDLRFGRVNSFQDVEPEYVFAYKIFHPNKNSALNGRALVEQQRNVGTPDKQFFLDFWNRIKGV